ncbi:ribose import ATP-binding protein RbsA [Peptococcaceae bacterium CEB3]|nr:ribose import ATP-binding protein RbsA [Peptococcaceae bacterium CEB3]
MLTIEGLRKEYGAVVALQGASLTLVPGTIHALLGANGSGKSTLVKMLGGVVRPTKGTIWVDEQRLEVGSPAHAIHKGIAVSYQETSLVPSMSVADNVLLGIEPTGKAGYVAQRSLRERAAEILDQLGLNIPPDVPVGELPTNIQHLLEIGKALVKRPKYMVLDEATAALRREEVKRLFSIVCSLRDEGVAILFVSHRFDEVYAICDRATVLRNGAVVGTRSLSNTSREELIQDMIGRRISLEPVQQKTGTSFKKQAVCLKARSLTNAELRGVDLEVSAGEIVGIGGLQGQGQTALLRALIGATTVRGDLETDGHQGLFRNPSHAAGNGVRFISGDRGREGVFGQRSIYENIVIGRIATFPLWKRASQRGENQAARALVEQLKIVHHSLFQEVRGLSGGNQQKVLFARTLASKPNVVILDDPTKGVDVSTRMEIHRLLRNLAGEGVGLLIASSDDEELAEVCDRVLIMYEGQIVRELTGDLQPSHITKASIEGAQSEKGKGAETRADSL